MRILNIEDDPATAQSISLMLQSEGMRVQTSGLGEEGLDFGLSYDYDLILLDLNLPDMSGFEVLKLLREAKVDTPIVILSGLAGIADKVKGLNLGADDYLTKPFHKDELVARILAVVRRVGGSANNIIVIGPLSIDLRKHLVCVEGKSVHLTRTEYVVLELLMTRQGEIVTKERMLNRVYGGRFQEPESKIFDVFICKLRKKLHSDNLIETVWGQGWRLNN